MVPHTRRSGSSLPLKNPSQIMRRQGPEKNMGVHAATQHFNPNPYNDESSMAPHPLRFFLPPQNPIRRMHRQCTTKYRSAQPPKTPTLECPQPIQQRNEYGATHPLRRVCGNIRVYNDTKRAAPAALLALLLFSHSAKPPSKESTGKAGRNTGMRAATQDPNSQLFATNTTRRPQIRSHTPAEAGPLSLCTTHLKNATQDPNPEYQR
ncbi:hypothetical protein BS47DRAFT_1366879 [Hydnum rufescens UP504]|uniref:Uncharacterized protein n=1 Tax=Hydnum rufescens UP504 TaxID=1448309 RepID=A0A9P6AJY8_9AGAM|nr:hypothetical protein BS47DRAFT_1366879 [Hydnum rufescens UP504]